MTRLCEAGASRLTGRDLLRAGSLGLRSRRVRAALSALGISIGIAAIVGVLGISNSSKTGLLNELGQLGNLLTAQPGSTASGQQAELPLTAEGMVSRIGPVTGVTAIVSISDTYVYRSPFIPAINTNGIALAAADPALPATLDATMAHGTFLNPATARYPAVVLGTEAASLLGIHDLAHPTQVWIGGHWFTVVGILNSVTQETTMDSTAFIGFPIAEQDFAFDGHPTELFVRTVNNPAEVNAVYNVLAATVNPADPSTVQVSQPADILQAELLTKGAYNGLFLALGPSPCSSAASASPTSWSSPSSNAAPRSACGAPWAPPAATSPSNSSPRPCSWRSWAAWPAPPSAEPPPPSTPSPSTGRC
jgi:putative ABC transport system permease protein